MSTIEELTELERACWDALATEGRAPAFYDAHLADEPLMLLPGGMVLDDRQSMIDSMSGPPWERHQLHDLRVLELGEDAGVVAYRARASRRGTDDDALFSSTWKRSDGDWKLTVHQQTPIA